MKVYEAQTTTSSPILLDKKWVCTLMAKQELESGISKGVVDLTSSIRKQNRDILGMGFCKIYKTPVNHYLQLYKQPTPPPPLLVVYRSRHMGTTITHYTVLGAHLTTLDNITATQINNNTHSIKSGGWVGRQGVVFNASLGPPHNTWSLVRLSMQPYLI